MERTNEYSIYPLVQGNPDYKFSGRAVAPDVVRELMEAVRWTPSAYNEQPWSFIVASRDQKVQHQRFLGCLTERKGEAMQQAPLVMLAVANLYWQSRGEPNRNALRDVFLAITNLTLQAVARGLLIELCSDLRAEVAERVFRIPEKHPPVSIIAAGYPRKTCLLAKSLHRREVVPRTRKSFSEFAFGGLWGSSLHGRARVRLQQQANTGLSVYQIRHLEGQIGSDADCHRSFEPGGNTSPSCNFRAGHSGGICRRGARRLEQVSEGTARETPL